MTPALPSSPEYQVPLTSGAPPTKGRILIAEDNPSNQLVATYMLESLGYASEVVPTGAEAVEILSRESFDLVLMDCQMPEMDGFEATQEIRKTETEGGPRIPIIAMTAYALKGDKKKCLKAGMDDYISKPVTVDILNDKIERMLNQGNENSASRDAAEPPSAEGAIDPRVLGELLKLQDETDSDIVGELTAIFLDDSPKRVSAISSAIENNDPEALEHNAHALKGSCTIIGAIGMKNIAYELEKIGQASRLDEAQGVLNRLEDEFVLVKEALEKKIWEK
jgi:CheY-like chemotaxis protein